MNEGPDGDFGIPTGACFEMLLGCTGLNADGSPIRFPDGGGGGGGGGGTPPLLPTLLGTDLGVLQGVDPGVSNGVVSLELIDAELFWIPEGPG